MSDQRRRRTRRGPDGPTPGGTADETPEADPESVARGIVLRQLTMAPRSRHQLAEALAKRGATDEVAAKVLDRFEDVGLVDDPAFAELLVRSRHEQRGLSRRALAHELRTKGVDRDVADAALEVVTDDSERAAARRLVTARLRSIERLPPDKQAQRLAGLLARKGYGAGVAYEIVREVLGERAAELADEAAPIE
ncbi:regulatory protein RecX [Angustibacter aerolatus]